MKQFLRNYIYKIDWILLCLTPFACFTSSTYSFPFLSTCLFYVYRWVSSKNIRKCKIHGTEFKFHIKKKEIHKKCSWILSTNNRANVSRLKNAQNKTSIKRWRWKWKWLWRFRCHGIWTQENLHELLIHLEMFIALRHNKMFFLINLSVSYMRSILFIYWKCWNLGNF